MNARAWVLAAGIAAVAVTVTWVPWKIHVRQKGDDLYPAWRYGWIFDEAAHDPRVVATEAGRRLHLAISPRDVEPMVDYQRVHLHLAAVVALTLFGWLLAGERASLSARAAPAPPDPC